MKITDVEPIVLRLPQVDTARADGTQDAFLVRVHTDEGIVGLGEADTAPLLARTIVEMPSSHSLARGLREVLVGEDPLQVDRLWQAMFHASDHYGRRGAALHVMSAIDIALWDIAGRAAGVPVSALLGGRRIAEIGVYANEVMPATPDEVHRIAAAAVESGYGALKLGWGPLGRDLAYDETLVHAARDELGPDRALMLDGGRAYTVKRALELLRRVEEHDLYWFEEALAPDDLDGYRRLSDAAEVRIAAGEADSGIAPFRALVERGHVDVLQPDVVRIGGISKALEVCHLANAAGLPVATHVSPELNFAVAAAVPNCVFVEYLPQMEPVLRSPLRIADGFAYPFQTPGHGIEFDADALARLEIENEPAAADDQAAD